MGDSGDEGLGYGLGSGGGSYLCHGLGRKLCHGFYQQRDGEWEYTGQGTESKVKMVSPGVRK